MTHLRQILLKVHPKEDFKLVKKLYGVRNTSVRNRIKTLWNNAKLKATEAERISDFEKRVRDEFSWLWNKPAPETVASGSSTSTNKRASDDDDGDEEEDEEEEGGSGPSKRARTDQGEGKRSGGDGSASPEL